MTRKELLFQVIGGVVCVIGFGLVLVFIDRLPQNHIARADENDLAEGLPIPISRLWFVPTERGTHLLWVESGRLASTPANYAWLMNDVNHPGHLGHQRDAYHGEITWIHLPVGYTLSVFPGHVSEHGGNPRRLEWLPELLAKMMASGLRPVLDSDGKALKGQVFGELVDENFKPLGVINEKIPPSEPCENVRIFNPMVVRFYLEVVGDISKIQLPEQIKETGLIYRVRVPTN